MGSKKGSKSKRASKGSTKPSVDKDFGEEWVTSSKGFKAKSSKLRVSKGDARAEANRTKSAKRDREAAETKTDDDSDNSKSSVSIAEV